MTLTEPTFVWSGSAFLLGAILMLDLNTFAAAIALYRKKMSAYYLALVGVTAAHMLNLTLANMGFQQAPQVGVAMPMSQTVLECSSLIFAWTGACGFIVLNFLRFRGVCARALHPGVLHAIQGGVGLFIALYTAFAITYFVVFIQVGDGTLPIDDNIPRSLNIASAICDAVMNGIISILFLRHLGTLVGNTNMPADIGFREGLGSLLNRARITLGFESSLIVCTNVAVAVVPEFDPSWASVCLAESVRLRTFCLFLETLARIMRQHANPGKPSLSSSQSESAVSTAGPHVAGPKSAVFGKTTAGDMAARAPLTAAPTRS
ncbi:hypothetical protein AMAG_02731 [Allomyces macrogynus ATCC 38327]|uniref:Integral membrane protein n=1 Tax=Allomyces macrogynus (strain ATCC 38327) TaxID=578462 RepID=A0A0L0S3K0_ALLM3|nr:hypothetical protein AMAG_02731 [Allomyces macrogynus ATCC 38327]|eukprot:KNE56965.1 hypothetical protein AMAG_02731 [Allomyces macrogynus ATCC 38327]